MGASYTNITLRGPKKGRIVAALRSMERTAFVGPTRDGCTIVFDGAAEEEAGENQRLAEALSRELGCAALAVLVHDDDILQYALCAGGAALDRYDSAPDYFSGTIGPPRGGDAALLSETIGGGRTDPAEVEAILRSRWKTEYGHETARHSALAAALGLPDYGVGAGYGYIRQGDEEELEGSLVHVGRPAEEPPYPELVQWRFGEDLPIRAARRSLAPEGGARLTALQRATCHHHVSVRYWSALQTGDAAAVDRLFAMEPQIYDPRGGRVEGGTGLERFAESMRAWMAGDDTPAGSAFAYLPFAFTETARRVVAEAILVFQRGSGLTGVPVVTVWERVEGGGYASVRGYYSRGPGRHIVRPPVRELLPDLQPVDVVRGYEVAFAEGDVEGVVACFAPDGWARGSGDVHRGAAELRAFYGALLSEGGISLRHCAVTDEGTTCAVEYVATRAAGDEIAPRAGIVVYERAAEGLLRSVRIYDDIDPYAPPE